MNKKQTMELGYNMGVLQFLLENTISCYEGKPKVGCGKCPACKLRNEGIREYLSVNPDFEFSYKSQIIS